MRRLAGASQAFAALCAASFLARELPSAAPFLLLPVPTFRPVPPIRSGGGLFVQQRCVPGDESCGPLLISGGTALRGNTALRGGGGAIFRLTHNLTNVTCAGASSQLPWTALNVGCP